MKIGRYERSSISGKVNENNRIEDDFMLLDSGFKLNMGYVTHPHKTDGIIISLILKGSSKGRVNLTDIQVNAPCLMIILPEQIIQMEGQSDDFSAMHIICSKKFADNLSKYYKEHFPLYMDVYNNPVLPLKNEELEPFTAFFANVKQTLSDLDNPYRAEILAHQSILFFYMTAYRYHQILPKTNKTTREALLDNFLDLVSHHYKQHHSLGFYAGKLGLTSKYLTTVIKQTSGTTAMEWIEKYIILEAQALLKSSNLTIQQISDMLNFSSQAFFGKFFKRLVGVSPSEYKKK